VRDDVEQLIGSSPAIMQIEAQIDEAAHCDAKVLITGESGVGKEVVARLIHLRSSRGHGPLQTLNCAGLPESLLESELFGHVRGAFTGAYRDKPGLLELGHLGTVFMDEVGEMSLRMQAVLLRFLETGEIRRVGSDRPHAQVDVRIIAATNRDLHERVTSRDFREDLYYRLDVLHLHVPALRERREDIQALVTYFVGRDSDRLQIAAPAVSPDALVRLVNYQWPGNVRQLRNVVQRLMLRHRSGGIVVPEDLPPEVAPAPPKPLPDRVRLPLAEALLNEMLECRATFWAVVYERFMARDLTREDLRAVIRLGLARTNGSYRMLVELFNLPSTDYKRFLNFLRKYECQMPFQEFRVLRAHVAKASPGEENRPKISVGI
jgi:transcriptional regulator with PAS, ATPase and Fis domain